MPVGLGVDIVEIERMRRILDRTPSFARKVFTQGEQDYCNAKANPATHYAARFAAKEAVCKALGTGILTHGITMHDVEVVRDSRGKPAVALHGAAARVAADQGVVDVPLSLTYTHSVAVANAVAITKESQAEREKHRDVKAELAQQFKELRGMLDDLSDETARAAQGVGAQEGQDVGVQETQGVGAQEEHGAEPQLTQEAEGPREVREAQVTGLSSPEASHDDVPRGGAPSNPEERLAKRSTGMHVREACDDARGASEESGRGRA